jgi:hypothetical protein
MIPHFDLGIPQIIDLNNTIALSEVDFNRLDKWVFVAIQKIKTNPYAGGKKR